MKPIKIPASDTKLIKIIEGGEDYLYLHPTHLRYISKGTLDDYTNDSLLPERRVFDLDSTVLKDKIIGIELSHSRSDDTYEIIITLISGSLELFVSSKVLGKDLLNRLLLWLLEPEEYFK